MKKKKLGILLILLLVFSVWGCQRKEEASKKTASPVERTEKKIASKDLTPEPFVYDRKGKRDPFIPLEETEKGTKLAWLSLEGILWKPEKPLAIINDQIVSKGDIVQGAEVIKIKEDGVTLRYGEEETFLKLK
ncbi:MAG: general secretion pathway protein GspB [Nitrospirae bacterium]|nr:general secretion pathway protein GspB [Nitrospirota bacterium]